MVLGGPGRGRPLHSQDKITIASFLLAALVWVPRPRRLYPPALREP